MAINNQKGKTQCPNLKNKSQIAPRRMRIWMALQDLIDAHIDEVTGGAFSLHIQYTDPPVPPVGPIRRY